MSESYTLVDMARDAAVQLGIPFLEAERITNTWWEEQLESSRADAEESARGLYESFSKPGHLEECVSEFEAANMTSEFIDDFIEDIMAVLMTPKYGSD